LSAVRAAGADALDDVLRFLVVEFYCRHRETLPELDIKKATAVIHRTLREGHVFVVEDSEGAIVGSLGLLPTDAAWFSSEQVLADPWFFVLPSHRRGSRIAVDLLNAAIDLADEKRARLLMAVVTAENVDLKHQFFRRHGFVQLGGMYERRIQ
jgi:GNAT superfamily N-acetyltransferase